MHAAPGLGGGSMLKSSPESCTGPFTPRMAPCEQPRPRGARRARVRARVLLPLPPATRLLLLLLLQLALRAPRVSAPAPPACPAPHGAPCPSAEAPGWAPAPGDPPRAETGTQGPAPSTPGGDAMEALQEWLETAQNMSAVRGPSAPFQIVVSDGRSSRETAQASTSGVRPSYGLAAARDLPAGEVILEVPPSLVIRSDVLLQEHGAPGSGLPALALGQEPFGREENSRWLQYVAVAAFVLRERAKGDASFWAPYVRVLPEYVPVAWLYPRELLEALEVEHIITELEEYRKDVDAAYDMIDPAAIAHATVEEFQWAMAMVGSRLFDVAHGKAGGASLHPEPEGARPSDETLISSSCRAAELKGHAETAPQPTAEGLAGGGDGAAEAGDALGEPEPGRDAEDIPNEASAQESAMVLVPLVDLLNHAEDANAGWQIQYSPASAAASSSCKAPRTLLEIDVSMTFRTIKNVSQGAELLASYGLSNNEHFLRGYGFALFPNSADDMVLCFGATHLAQFFGAVQRHLARLQTQSPLQQGSQVTLEKVKGLAEEAPGTEHTQSTPDSAAEIGPGHRVSEPSPSARSTSRAALHSSNTEAGGHEYIELPRTAFPEFPTPSVWDPLALSPDAVVAKCNESVVVQQKEIPELGDLHVPDMDTVFKVIPEDGLPISRAVVRLAVWGDGFIDPRLLAAFTAFRFIETYKREPSYPAIASASLLFGRHLGRGNCTDMATLASAEEAQALRASAADLRLGLTGSINSFSTSLAEDQALLQQLDECLARGSSRGVGRSEEDTDEPTGDPRRGWVHLWFRWGHIRNAAHGAVRWLARLLSAFLWSPFQDDVWGECREELLEWAQEWQAVLRFRMSKKSVLAAAINRLEVQCIHPQWDGTAVKH